MCRTGKGISWTGLPEYHVLLGEGEGDGENEIPYLVSLPPPSPRYSGYGQAGQVINRHTVAYFCVLLGEKVNKGESSVGPSARQLLWKPQGFDFAERAAKKRRKCKLIYLLLTPVWSRSPGLQRSWFGIQRYYLF